jgi:hypothetical protein
MSEPDSYIKPEVVLNSPPVIQPVAYNRRDVILYALGVGAKDLRFLYEGGNSFFILPKYSKKKAMLFVYYFTLTSSLRVLFNINRSRLLCYSNIFDSLSVSWREQ